MFGYIYIYICLSIYLSIYEGFPGSSDGKESACNAGDLGSVPGLGRSPGEGTGFLLHFFQVAEVKLAKTRLGYNKKEKLALYVTAGNLNFSLESP